MNTSLANLARQSAIKTDPGDAPPPPHFRDDTSSSDDAFSMDEASDSDSGDIQHIKPAAVKPTLNLKNVPIWDNTISTRDNAQAIKIALGSAGYRDTTKGKGTRQEQMILLAALRHATAHYPMALAIVNGINMDSRKCGYAAWTALFTELQGSAIEERRRLEEEITAGQLPNEPVQLALRLRAEVERVWGRLGLAKHPTKAHPKPTQQLQHLGMDLDLGQFLYLAMPPARFYLREAHTVLGRCSSPSGKVVLTRQLIRDLEWWRDVPTRHNGAPIMRPVETAYLHTDSSQYGWVVVLCETMEARGYWYEEDRRRHILYKELKALLDDLVLKLQQSGAVATVVAPAWHGRPWPQQLHEMATERSTPFFTDNFKEPPALWPFVNQAMRGWELAQQVLDVPDYRVPLPANVALECVRRTQRLVSYKSIACDLPTFRAMLVTAVNFLFCHRAGTSTGFGVRDLAVDFRSIALYRRVLEGKPSGAPRPVLQISREAHPEIAELLEFFVTCRDHVLPGATRFWQLSDDDPGTWTAATVSEWVTADALAVDATPPAGFCWSSHNLRSGGASAASATGVPMPMIRWLGGWKVGSGVVLNYIVPGILDSDGASYFFGSQAPQLSAANLSQ
eukprot:jgi/Tetstr1/464391/TSEL_009184.t1